MFALSKETVFQHHVCQPNLCQRLKPLSLRDVRALGSTNDCCSYLLFLCELQSVGGCLCHGYISHVLWDLERFSFPPFTAVFFSTKGAHMNSEPLCSIGFYPPLPGQHPEEPAQISSRKQPPSQHGLQQGWHSCSALGDTESTSQNDPGQTPPLRGGTSSD